MDLLEAQKIAEKHLDAIKNSCPVAIEFNYEITEEFPVGYVFYYNSKEYWKTKDFSKSLAGNRPLLVKRDSGEVISLPSNKAVKRSLRELGFLS